MYMYVYTQRTDDWTTSGLESGVVEVVKGGGGGEVTNDDKLLLTDNVFES